jgi:Uma2 family endonuclease
MRLQVVDENGVAVREACEVRLSGWTEERFFAEAPEEGLSELKGGQLIVHSPVSIEHQEFVVFLTCLLRGFVSKESLGEVFGLRTVVRLGEGLCRLPDVVFVSSGRPDALTPDYVAGGPDFVIEIVSEGSRTRDLKEKAREYVEAGTPEYWAVDSANREVVVHRLTEGRYGLRKVAEGRLESTAVPGFRIEVEWLWQRPLPSEFDCLGEIAG